MDIETQEVLNTNQTIEQEAILEQSQELSQGQMFNEGFIKSNFFKDTDDNHERRIIVKNDPEKRIKLKSLDHDELNYCFAVGYARISGRKIEKNMKGKKYVGLLPIPILNGIINEEFVYDKPSKFVKFNNELSPNQVREIGKNVLENLANNLDGGKMSIVLDKYYREWRSKEAPVKMYLIFSPDLSNIVVTKDIEKSKEHMLRSILSEVTVIANPKLNYFTEHLKEKYNLHGDSVINLARIR